ncbi:hypothetical protein BKA81DRAFT_87420 [Phyllosticta paracitricarpa]
MSEGGRVGRGKTANQGAPGPWSTSTQPQRGLPRLTLALGGKKALLVMALRTKAAARASDRRTGLQRRRPALHIAIRTCPIARLSSYILGNAPTPTPKRASRPIALNRPSGPTPHNANLWAVILNSTPSPLLLLLLPPQTPVSGSINSSILSSSPPRPGAICVTRS